MASTVASINVLSLHVDVAPLALLCVLRTQASRTINNYRIDTIHCGSSMTMDAYWKALFKRHCVYSNCLVKLWKFEITTRYGTDWPSLAFFLQPTRHEQITFGQHKYPVVTEFAGR